MFGWKDVFLYLKWKSADNVSPLGNGVCGYWFFEILSWAAEITGPFEYFIKQTWNYDGEM